MPLPSRDRNLRKKVLASDFLPIGLACGLLALMTLLMSGSAAGDAVTADEDEHISAGFSYLKKGELRLNPEHPPLMKDLAALPLLRMNPKAPWDHPSWTDEVNGTDRFARAFLLHSGNDLETIVQAARKPMIVFTALLGLAVFFWTRCTFGAAAALLATFFFAFSPTFLAHGRLVTTDVGASAGFFIATIAYLHFLEKPTIPNVLLAGAGLGFALLTKFSTFLLLPIDFILTLLWAALSRSSSVAAQEKCHTCRADRESPAATTQKLRTVRWWLGRYFAIVTLAFLTLYPVYWRHTRNYPPERERRDATEILSWLAVGVMRRTADFMASHQLPSCIERAVRDFPKDLVIFMADKPVLRAYAPYFFGLLFVWGRATYGNAKYFLGQVSESKTPLYFPFVYAVKEPLALHILTIVAGAFAVKRFLDAPSRGDWAHKHFVESAFAIVIAVYWLASIRCNLNIGVRHLLPVFIPLYILAAACTSRLLSKMRSQRSKSIAAVCLAGLLIWQAFSIIAVYPYYIAYFNELAGGPEGGYRYVVDSNLDWGQDLKRLARFVEQNHIDVINLDYFGRAEPEYYLGSKYRPLHPTDAARKGWIAVSASLYQASRVEPSRDYRRWLPLSKRVAAIGHSIFVFYNK